ncbi:thioredoxin fold domain-containing protein [Ramlibacter tataouinensis]|uniref:thioredoxin fold domain-containing protein n=1 Tax=Ramlibacter tataouinensis TaxID=94132 RepID=UPI0022F37DFE|nr:thioredoxin fold domain-containing protein [Ramlibacter tataouinensis]WBY03262.1 thioredoxin fold domain-containing protein [Ramlibacter tataouinensis]
MNHSLIRRRTLAAIPALVALTLAGCGRESSGTAGGKAAPIPVSVEAIEQQAKGFSLGSAMAARVIYVFFDPQCPHCAALWEAVRPLRGRARFVWIPVALLNDRSGPQGATILNAADPVAAMDRHETSLRSQQGGIAAMGVTDEQKAVIQRNTQLMNSFGFGSVPTAVGKHGVTGELVTLEGSAPTEVVAQRFGLGAG